MKRSGRYAATRQKACKQCSTAKVKCDRKPGRCTRCDSRGLSCIYARATSTRSMAQDVNHETDMASSSPMFTSSTISTAETIYQSPGRDEPTTTGTWDQYDKASQFIDDSTGFNTYPTISTLTNSNAIANPALNATKPISESSEKLDFSALDLICPINADEISNRWLHPYIPVPGQSIKQYPPAITNFIDRILKSYVMIAVRGRGVPPFVHPVQLTTTSTSTSTPSPLTTCLTLIRVCEKTLPGSDSIAADVLQREMTNLYQHHHQQRQHTSHDEMTSLTTFQAYLLYSMTLFLTLNQRSNPSLRTAIINLQDLACSTSRLGLICTSESQTQHSRPKWESWIIAEAKRRTLYTMYLFDSLLSAQDDLPTFVGTELAGLPAPADKSLWRATTRREWQGAYNLHLVDWADGGGGLRIDELWPVPVCLGVIEKRERRARVDRWLEGVDEFGTMLFTVTSCTHGD